MSTGRLPSVAAVDWGTSRLRIWLMDRDGMPLAEHRSDEGMLIAAERGFAAILERALASMGAPIDLPAIICGMAGAKQGWIEAPYVTTPAAISAVFAGAVPASGTGRAIRIIPGIASMEPADVMRGEETQLAGAASHFATGRQLVCMPGTHSKWVDVEDGVVKSFSTWLTGELFALLASSSILRHTIGSDTAVSPANPVFAHWLKDAFTEPRDVTKKLFRLRAAGLLHGMKSGDAAAALSGLLIGTEIASANPWERSPDGKVLLIASGTLRDLYAEALRLADCPVTVVDADEAVRAGLFAAARHHFRLSGGEVDA